MQCMYCGKIFEDPIKFEKHRCKVMKRMELISPLLLDTYIAYEKQLNKKKIKKTDTEEILSFLKSSLFDFIMKFSKFCEENELNSDDYIKAMIALKFKRNDWTTPTSLERYILYRADNEPSFIGYERSKKYLEKKNIDICELSPMELYNLIKDGWISKYYFISENIDVRSLLPRDLYDDLWDLL